MEARWRDERADRWLQIPPTNPPHQERHNQDGRHTAAVTLTATRQGTRMPRTTKRHRSLKDAPPQQAYEEPPSHVDSIISALPDAVLVYNILSSPCLEPSDLCNLLRVSKGLKTLQTAHDALLWSRHVQSGNIVADAVALAGSNRTYAQQKERSKQEAVVSGWQGPCEFELCASLLRISSALQGVDSSHIIFLLDGSGSVGEEEFDASASFIIRAAGTAKSQSPQCKIQVVQFSSDVKTEWEDSPADTLDPPVFESAVKGMVRMNGGTNIAAALTHAGKALRKSSTAETAKVIVLITDGRVDGHQAKEARQVASQLTDEHPNTTMFAYGVGRGIDRAELLGIIAAAPPSPSYKHQEAESRYLDLFFKDEAPW